MNITIAMLSLLLVVVVTAAAAIDDFPKLNTRTEKQKKNQRKQKLMNTHKAFYF